MRPASYLRRSSSRSRRIGSLVAAVHDLPSGEKIPGSLSYRRAFSLTGTGVHDHRNPCSSCRNQRSWWPESVFSIGRNRRSRSAGMGVHDGPERAFWKSRVPSFWKPTPTLAWSRRPRRDANGHRHGTSGWHQSDDCGEGDRRSPSCCESVDHRTEAPELNPRKPPPERSPRRTDVAAGKVGNAARFCARPVSLVVQSCIRWTRGPEVCFMKQLTPPPAEIVAGDGDPSRSSSGRRHMCRTPRALRPSGEIGCVALRTRVRMIPSAWMTVATWHTSIPR